MKRAIIIVLDSVGIGALPDAGIYGDEGSNTLGNISESLKDKGWFKLPNLERMGLGLMDGVDYLSGVKSPLASFARLGEMSKGKDTTTGHWEMTGIILNKPFPVYPKGFPPEVISAFEELIHRKTLGNYSASGTEIIAILGEEHVKTGFPIVYTSADSVFQIAAHEDVIPVDSLYEMCETARKILTGEHAVGRVIARPFIGSPGNFKRTDRRRDFSLSPIKKTLLDYASEQGYDVRGVGKIEDIFNGKGVTMALHTHDNTDGVNTTVAWMKDSFTGILFTNLVDFDMQYGHRNNVEGYGRALVEFDDRLPEILDMIQDEDILFITADHGCDPTTASTDHSREYTPLLVYGKFLKSGVNLGTRSSFSDIAATIAEYLNINADIAGRSFFKAIAK